MNESVAVAVAVVVVVVVGCCWLLLFCLFWLSVGYNQPEKEN